MSAESLTTPFRLPQQVDYSETERKRESSSKINPTGSRKYPEEPWSIRKLISRHVSRRYRVLEREPNRLRKRATQ
jgi:hypothetical protein